MNDKERYYASVAANTIHDITRNRNTWTPSLCIQ